MFEKAGLGSRSEEIVIVEYCGEEMGNRYPSASLLHLISVKATLVSCTVSPDTFKSRENSLSPRLDSFRVLRALLTAAPGSTPMSFFCCAVPLSLPSD